MKQNICKMLVYAGKQNDLQLILVMGFMLSTFENIVPLMSLEAWVVLQLS